MTDKSQLVKALDPIVSRVRTDVCWMAKPDSPPWQIEEPLTHAKMLKHVNGGPKYGAAPIKPGTSTTLVGLFDLDSHKGQTPWPEMQEVGLKLIVALEQRGAKPIAFRSSGGNGMHIYLLWDAPQDAYSVRTFMSAVLESIGLKSGTKGIAAGQVEVFPKQNKVAEGSYGNMFILPLAGKSVPLDSFELENMPKDYVLKMRWPVSTPVTVVERPVPVARLAGPVSTEFETLASALRAIPNDGDGLAYDEWLKVLMALHHETAASAEGLGLAHDFSSRSAKYNPDEVELEWGRFKGVSDNDNGIATGRSILFLAREHGWTESVDQYFDVVETADEHIDQPPPLPKFVRKPKTGEILATMDNLTKAIARPDMIGMEVGYDCFRDELMYSKDKGINWLPFKDADYTEVRIVLERRGFISPSKESTREAVLWVAERHKFDSAQVWLSRLEWDGKPRIEGFLHRYMACDDSLYIKAVSRYMWTALAGRVLSPGCKADMAPILIGRQGARKSSAVAAMVPAPQYFTEVSFDEKEDDLSRKMRGRLIAELAELKGLQGRDSDHIKAWVSRRFEDWTPKYREFNTVYPRRLLIIGTTNRDEFLSDDTGNRRWLPAKVGELIDVDAIARDCLQLWAEAKEMFESTGVDFKEAELLAGDMHGEHMMSDSWEPIIAKWLMREDDLTGDIPASRKFLLTHEVLAGALNLDAKNCKRFEEMRIGSVLRALGFERKKARVGGRLEWVFVKQNG